MEQNTTCLSYKVCDFDLLTELYSLPLFKEWQKDNYHDEYAHINWTPIDIYFWLMGYNWYIIVIPEFYQNGVNYNVQISHYGPNSYKEEWKQIDDKSAIVYKDYADKRASLYGDNGEFSTYLDALKYGIKWCINIIKTGKTDLI